MRTLPLVPWQMRYPQPPSAPNLATFANHGARALKLGTLPPNEFGVPLCMRPDGTLDRQVAVSWGTPTGVNVDMGGCPPGTRVVGSLHSHPGGVPFPSRVDQAAAIASASELMCIVADGPGHRQHPLNCFRIRAAR